jgi:hypothetical protein
LTHDDILLLISGQEDLTCYQAGTIQATRETQKKTRYPFVFNEVERNAQRMGDLLSAYGESARARRRDREGGRERNTCTSSIELGCSILDAT